MPKMAQFGNILAQFVFEWPNIKNIIGQYVIANFGRGQFTKLCSRPCSNENFSFFKNVYIMGDFIIANLSKSPWTYQNLKIQIWRFLKINKIIFVDIHVDNGLS